jgi:hypothetical protein
MNNAVMVIDGMLSGTGIRDGVNGGYLEPSELGVSERLEQRISAWLSRYENAHFHNYEDQDINKVLDQEGADIARELAVELPSVTVKYFSNAYFTYVSLE